jgi:type I restriction enzyme, S subunit
VQIKENDKYHLAPNFAKIVSSKKLVPNFLEMMLRSQKVQQQFQSVITTTANPSLTRF